MGLLANIGSGILAVLLWIWLLFVSWLGILVEPFLHLRTLWIIVPIWLIWFFSEFFQEKRGTSFGNAITNGAVALWVSIDWTRFLTTSLTDKTITFGFAVFFQYLIAAIVFAYALVVIIYGIKGRAFVLYIGRIREATYIMAIFTPIIYGLIPLSFRFFLSVVLFFPVFYYVIELLDKYVPDPFAVRKDVEKEDAGLGSQI